MNSPLFTSTPTSPSPTWIKTISSDPLPFLLLIGLLCRVTALLLYLSAHEWKGERWEYELIAQNLLNGKGYVIDRHNALYYAFIPPLFPFICYVLHLMGGNGPLYQWLYYTFHIGLALGIIWLSYRLASTWFGQTVAMIAGLLIAMHPGLIIYHSYKMDVITLSSFLLLASVWFFQQLHENRKLRTASLLGAVIGLGLLTRLDLVILLGPLGLWLWHHRRNIGQILKPALWTLAITCLVISPWLIRNYLVLDRFIFIASTSGEWMWIGNNPGSSGTAVALNGEGVFFSAPATLQQAVMAGKDEFQINHIYMEAALRYITLEPGRFLRLAAAKFWYFWWFTPTYGWQYQHIGESWRLAYKVLHGAVLILMVFGVWSIFRERRETSRQGVLVILTLCLMLAGIHSLTYVEGRHRLLVEPLLLILAAVGLQAAQELFSQKTIGKTGTSAKNISLNRPTSAQ